MKEFDFDTVIPGHGAVTNKAGLLKYRNDVEKLATQVSFLIKKGQNKDDVRKMLIADYAWDPAGLPMRVSLDGMLNEMK
jgi:hypothetical protein